MLFRSENNGITWLSKLKSLSRLTVYQIKHPRDNHFLVTTGGFFRFVKDKNKAEAEANFNEPSVCKVLIEAFHRYKEDASLIRV